MKNQYSRVRHYITALVCAAAGVFIDQVTKYFALSCLKGQEPYVIIRNVFQLEYLENRGAAFGLFQNQRIVFFCSVAVVCSAAVWFYVRVPMEKRYFPLRVCAVLIMAGAFGNFIDRVRLNYVVDFFYFKLIDFPVFNVADIFVTTATFLLFLLLCFYYKEEELERILHSGK